MTTCTTCGKQASSPFRAYGQDGNIVHGCIDAFHNDALVPFSNSYSWHYRKSAKAFRVAVAKRMRDLLR